MMLVVALCTQGERAYIMFLCSRRSYRAAIAPFAQPSPLRPAMAAAKAGQGVGSADEAKKSAEAEEVEAKEAKDAKEAEEAKDADDDCSDDSWGEEPVVDEAVEAQRAARVAAWRASHRRVSALDLAGYRYRYF